MITGTKTQAVRSNASRAHLALGAMALIWGINFPISKAALTQLDPLAFNALRFPLAVVVVMLALRGRGGITWPPPGKRMRVLLLGILGNVVYQQFFIFGLALTRAGTASVLLAATPIITALLSAAVGHERLPARTWIGVVATLVGVILVVGFSPVAGAGTHSLVGDALMLCAAFAWAVYTVGSRSLVNEYGSVQFTAWTLWIGAIGLCLVGLPAVVRTDLSAVTVDAWLGVVYAGALSIGVAYLIWYYGVRMIGNTRTSTYSNVVPVIALVAAWVRLGEVPSAGQVVGAVVILGGVSLAQLSIQTTQSGSSPATHDLSTGL